MGKISKLLVGLLVISVGAFFIKRLAVLLWSLLSFVLISIMCTGGVALVAWVPLAILIGFVIISIGSAVLGVLVWCFRNGAKDQRTDEGVPETVEGLLKGTRTSPAHVQKGQLAIERYIDRAKFYGLSHEQTLSALKNGGWSDAEIQKAYHSDTVPQ